MPASIEPNRHSAIALTAAVAATTVAIGVTAATLLGWFRPATPTTAPLAERSVVYVPIAPETSPAAATSEEPAQLAMEQPRERDDDDEREHERERDDD